MSEFFRGPSGPYVIPFLVFLALLGLQDCLPLPQAVEFPLRCLILAGVLWYFSRPVISFRTQTPVLSILIGVAVFLIWIGPDYLFPGYRQHWLFSNWIVGHVATKLDDVAQGNPATLFFRVLRAVILVPIIEELFWRAWALRWIGNPNFQQVPLGWYSTSSFWIVAVLFAAEHGPFWEVGLVCGILWNWWMGRTRSLGDLILTHAVTNGCLSAYVLIWRKWEYWM
jgi:uncharacterized protein